MAHRAMRNRSSNPPAIHTIRRGWLAGFVLKCVCHFCHPSNDHTHTHTSKYILKTNSAPSAMLSYPYIHMHTTKYRETITISAVALKLDLFDAVLTFKCLHRLCLGFHNLNEDTRTRERKKNASQTLFIGNSADAIRFTGIISCTQIHTNTLNSRSNLILAVSLQV